MDRRQAAACVATMLLAGCGGGGGGGADLATAGATAAASGAPGAPAPAVATRDIAAWGDSHTSGVPDNPAITGFASRLQALVPDRQVFDGGMAGQTSTEIADRMVQDEVHDTWLSIFWYGGNNETESDRVKADLARSIASLAPGNDHFVVLSVVNSSAPWERRGTPDYQSIVQLDADLAALYPGHYLDVRSFLVGRYDPNDTTDVADHQDDIPPTSLRTDGVHLNDKGYEAVARFVLQFIQSQGW